MMMRRQWDGDWWRLTCVPVWLNFGLLFVPPDIDKVPPIACQSQRTNESMLYQDPEAEQVPYLYEKCAHVRRYEDARNEAWFHEEVLIHAQMTCQAA